MENYVILTDGTSDLCKAAREELGVEYVKLHVTSGDKEYLCSLDWDDSFTAKEFYDRIRQGEVFKTTQVALAAYEEAFESYAAQGRDVLSISVSSGLSGSFNASRLAAESVLKKYPERKIITVDSLRGSGALGLIVRYASRLRQQGKTIEETAAWIEENKAAFHQFGTVEDLVYLKRCGRVTGFSHAMGKILKIKPIIVSNAKGENESVLKVRGRLTSIQKLIELTRQNITDSEEQVIHIVHADCIKEAELLKAGLLEKVKCKDVYISIVNASVGASTGPGMLGVFFKGKKIT